MKDHHKNSRLNLKSYVISTLLTLPAFWMSTGLARSNSGTVNEDLGVTSFAKVVSLSLAIILILWTVKRLHDTGHSGWYSFFLIPPFTIFLWFYTFTAPSIDGDTKYGARNTSLRIFGFTAKGGKRITAISFVAILMVYFTVLFASFLYA